MTSCRVESFFRTCCIYMKTPPEFLLSVDKPLVIDVDGTLIRNDLTVELLFNSVCENPHKALHWFRLALYDKTSLKDELVQNLNPAFDVAALPFNEIVVSLGETHKNNGGEVILCSGSHHILVEQISDQFDWIDQGHGTRNGLNLVSGAKAEYLKNMYPGGFAYVGNSKQDFEAWELADQGFAISPPNNAKKIVSKDGQPPRVLEEKPNWIKSAFKSMRPHQWAKNLLIALVPALTLKELNLTDIGLVAIGFIAMCLLTSATYILNDVLDISNDRQHAIKKNRAIASGRLSFQRALTVMLFLFGSSLGLSFLLPPLFNLVLLTYLIITLSYSFGLKQVAILDVLILAGLFTIRVIAGGTLVAQEIAPWLLGFVATFFLSLAMVKRYTELRRQTHDKNMPGRGYVKEDESLVLSFGVMTTGMAILCLLLYGLLAENPLFNSNVSIFALLGILTFWLMRVWLLAHRRVLADDPVLFAIKDKTSLALGVGVAIIVVVQQLGMNL